MKNLPVIVGSSLLTLLIVHLLAENKSANTTPKLSTPIPTPKLLVEDLYIVRLN